MRIYVAAAKAARTIGTLDDAAMNPANVLLGSLSPLDSSTRDGIASGYGPGQRPRPSSMSSHAVLSLFLT
jgi:hypothetical protein